VVIGYYAGKFIQQKGKGFETIARLMLVGSLFIFVAIWWNMVFPINKKLWTSPFVLLTTGLDLMILSALIYIIEIKNWTTFNWTNFFVILGKNPLFIYLLSELLLTIIVIARVQPGTSFYNWVNNVFFQMIAPGALGSFLFAISYMLLCWMIGWWLNKRKIYIRV
jgi:predicted acyltransferase